MKSDRRIIDILPQAALALMMAAFCFALYSQLHEIVVNAGDKAPNFKIAADNGQTISPHDFGGKLLLVNFWASYCAPCVDETPGLNDLARQLGPKGLVVFGISKDQDESAYKKFIANNQVVFPTARDPAGDIQLSYGTILIPESYLIDRNGRVIEKFISSQPWDSPQMIEHVQSLL
jgi:cytochrome c biogenesis protein CcmG/thiol:disulfide interchange protein DsbE